MTVSFLTWFTLWKRSVSAVLLHPSCWVSHSEMLIQFDVSIANLTMEHLWLADTNPWHYKQLVITFLNSMGQLEKLICTFLAYWSWTGEMMPPSTSWSFFCRKSLASSCFNRKEIDCLEKVQKWIDQVTKNSHMHVSRRIERSHC